MKALSNLNAPDPPAARVAVRPNGLPHRSLHIASMAVALILTASSVASARIETLRWTHSTPSDVAGFTIYHGPSSANYTTVIDVPPLQPDAQGVFSFDIDVPDDATIYVSVTAYDGAGLESGYSNEGIRSPGSSTTDPAIGKPGTPYVVSP
jgi:hypothetical protein